MSECHKEHFEKNLAIEISGLCKSFGNRIVLENISFNLSQGQGLCLCGPNAAGKTTLLRIIAGLLKQNAGTVKVCGLKLPDEISKIKPNLGAIFHKSMTYPHLTVEENLRFFASMYGIENGQMHLDQLIDKTGLSPYRYDKAGILSRGISQRLSIARALIHKPKLLLADEPFSGLDAEACEHLIGLFIDFKLKGGTVILISHNIESAVCCCEQVAILDNHKIIFNEPVDGIDKIDFARDYLSYARNNH